MIGWALALALVWTGLQGEATLANFVLGFGLAWGALAVVRPLGGRRFGTRWRPVPMVALAALFVRELFVSNARVFAACLWPQGRDRAVIAVPLTVEGPAAIAVFANLVTLTPGTLSLDVSEDRRTLFVHTLFCSEAEESQVRSGLAAMERRVKEAME